MIYSRKKTKQRILVTFFKFINSIFLHPILNLEIDLKKKKKISVPKQHKYNCKQLQSGHICDITYIKIYILFFYQEQLVEVCIL